MIEKTYVYDGKEVILTGRIAKKEMTSGKTRQLHEIRPIEIEDSNRTFNKWVEMKELFEIED